MHHASSSTPVNLPYLHLMKMAIPFRLLIALLLFLAACKKSNDTVTPPPPPPVPVAPVVTTDNDPMLLGNPSNAITDAAYPNNYFKNNIYYSISYNNSRGTSNWVAWHLQSEDLGSTPRQDDFRPDAGLPAAFNIIDAAAYSGSGFDRGHNCPSADRTTTVAANSSTFFNEQHDTTGTYT